MPAEEAVFPIQHRNPRSGAETVPWRPMKAPSTTATSAGTGGKACSTAERTTSTAYTAIPGRPETHPRHPSATEERLAHEMHDGRVGPAHRPPHPRGARPACRV